jgi:hypothetical protein
MVRYQSIKGVSLTAVWHSSYTFVKRGDTCHASRPLSARNTGYCCHGVPIAIGYKGKHALISFGFSEKIYLCLEIPIIN